MTISSLNKEGEKNANSLTCVEKIVVLRANILQTALQRYWDSNILNKKLPIPFIGEIGEELDSLTWEFFALFWKEFLTNYTYGTNQKNIKVGPVQTLSKEKGYQCKGSCSVDFYYVHIFQSP